MSYCRFGKDSDVYVFNNGTNYEVYWHKANESEVKSISVSKLSSLLDILNHLKRGYRIPKSTFNRIKKEIKHNEH